MLKNKKKLMIYLFLGLGFMGLLYASLSVRKRVKSLHLPLREHFATASANYHMLRWNMRVKIRPDLFKVLSENAI